MFTKEKLEFIHVHLSKFNYSRGQAQLLIMRDEILDDIEKLLDKKEAQNGKLQKKEKVEEK